MYRWSRSIEKNELPNSAFFVSDTSSTCGSVTARDHMPQRPSAPLVMYTSELHTPIELPITRSGLMPSSSRRLRQPAW